MEKVDLVICKDNSLIEASYKLTLMEQRIILFILSKLDSRKPQYQYDFNVSEFLIFFPDLDSSGLYKNLKIAVEKLWNRSVITDHPEYIQKFRWVSSICYLKKEARIIMRFTHEIMPYLFQLEKHFTKYNLKNISNFKSNYSIRLYELLTQYKSLKERSMDLENLKKILQIENKYSRIESFKTKILHPSIKEINEKSDLIIDYSTIKKGRVITGLIFSIKSKFDNES